MRLNKLFGKNVSTSMLRHIWTSDKYKDMPSLKELTANAEAMGHSVAQHLEYIVR
jgi:L-rhamnose isomerase